MAIFDRLRGRREQKEEVDAAAAQAAAQVSPSLDLDTSGKEALRDPSRTISTEVTPGVSFRHEEQGKLYNPYEGGRAGCSAGGAGRGRGPAQRHAACPPPQDNLLAALAALHPRPALHSPNGHAR